MHPPLYFWRDQTGHEVDALVAYADTFVPIEVKAGRTVNLAFFDELRYLNKLAGTSEADNIIIYGGDEDQKRSLGHLMGWRALARPEEWLKLG